MVLNRLVKQQVFSVSCPEHNDSKAVKGSIKFREMIIIADTKNKNIIKLGKFKDSAISYAYESEKDGKAGFAIKYTASEVEDWMPEAEFKKVHKEITGRDLVDRKQVFEKLPEEEIKKRNIEKAKTALNMLRPAKKFGCMLCPKRRNCILTGSNNGLNLCQELPIHQAEVNKGAREVYDKERKRLQNIIAGKEPEKVEENPVEKLPSRELKPAQDIKQVCNNCGTRKSCRIYNEGILKIDEESCSKWEDEISREKIEKIYDDLFKVTGIDNVMMIDGIKYFKRRIQESLDRADNKFKQDGVDGFYKAFEWIGL